MTSKKTLEDAFEEAGEEAIRLQLQRDQIQGQTALYASQWLGKKAQAAEARKEAPNRKHMAIARSAKNAAWAAAIAAIIAAIAAVVAIALSIPNRLPSGVPHD